MKICLYASTEAKFSQSGHTEANPGQQTWKKSLSKLKLAYLEKLFQLSGQKVVSSLTGIEREKRG